MSMFMCSRCRKIKDSDFHVCQKDPDDELELVCEECNERDHKDRDIQDSRIHARY